MVDGFKENANFAEQKSAQQALKWIERYTGFSIQHLDEDRKREALEAYAECASAMMRDGEGNLLDERAQRATYHSAEKAIEWIERYTGFSIQSLDEDRKREALDAYVDCASLDQN